MSNETATVNSPSFDNNRVNATLIPLWIVIMWTVVGTLLAFLIILIVFWGFKSRRIIKQRLNSMEESKNKELPYIGSSQDFQPMEMHMINQFQARQAGKKKKVPSRSTFVDHKRIPRAVEVKIVESINALPQDDALAYPAYCTGEFDNVHGHFELSKGTFESDRPSIVRSREHSFRHFGGTDELTNEKIYREKLLVSELQEKLKTQKKLNNNDRK